MENEQLGQAYCHKCDRLSIFVLTGAYEHCTHCAGLNWEAASDQFCECGEPFRWMHQPPPEPLEFAFTLESERRINVYRP